MDQSGLGKVLGKYSYFCAGSGLISLVTLLAFIELGEDVILNQLASMLRQWVFLFSIAKMLWIGTECRLNLLP